MIAPSGGCLRGANCSDTVLRTGSFCDTPPLSGSRWYQRRFTNVNAFIFQEFQRLYRRFAAWQAASERAKFPYGNLLAISHLAEGPKMPLNTGNDISIRTKTVGVRVTAGDFECLQSIANAQGKSLSEWCRDVLLRAARHPEGNPFEQAMIGEMMALRTFMTEPNYYYVSKSSRTFENMKAIWKRAEESKHAKARELLRKVGIAARATPPPQKE